MPADYWWVTGGVLFILALAATVDAFTSLVPDGLILLGVIAVVGTQGRFDAWPLAAHHFAEALAAGFLIWGVNFAWYTKTHSDALGMGDAKWTVLAVACFGPEPALFAWGLGAILASCYIGIARLFRYQVSRVTFAPFLFLGLCCGLYWVRFIAPVLAP